MEHRLNRFNGFPLVTIWHKLYPLIVINIFHDLKNPSNLRYPRSQHRKSEFGIRN